MFRCGNVESADKDWEKFRDIVKEPTRDVWAGREEIVVNDRVKMIWLWSKREELLQNGGI